MQAIHKVFLENYVLYGFSRFPNMLKDYPIKPEHFTSQERRIYFEQLSDLIGKFEFGAAQHNIAHVTRLAGLSEKLMNDILGHPVSNESQNREFAIRLLEENKLADILESINNLGAKSLKSDRPGSAFCAHIERLVKDKVSGDSSIESAESKSYFEILERGLDRKEESILTGTPQFLSSGFKNYDRFMAGGFRNSGLYVVVAAGGVGKTTFVGQIAQNIVRDSEDDVVVYFQSEMDEFGIGDLGSMALMQRSMRESPTLSDIEFARKELEKREYLKRIHIYDRSRLDTDYVVGTLNFETRRFPVKFVIVDHVGFWKENSIYSAPGNENSERSFAIKTLKTVAKDYRLPVLALSHSTREALKLTEGQSMTMAMISWSSEFERLADSVIGMTREPTGVNSIVTMKSRFGGAPNGSKFNLVYNPQTQLFVEETIEETNKRLGISNNKPKQNNYNRENRSQGSSYRNTEREQELF